MSPNSPSGARQSSAGVIAVKPYTSIPAASAARRPSGLSSTTAHRSGATPTVGRVQEQVRRRLADAHVLRAEEPVPKRPMSPGEGPSGCAGAARTTRRSGTPPRPVLQHAATPGTASTRSNAAKTRER